VTVSLAVVMPQAEAGFVPTSDSFSSPLRQHDLTRIRKAIEQKAVMERLKALGYSKEEINARLADLTDDELQRLAAQIDSLVPAGDMGVIGAIFLVTVIVCLVIIILKLTGHRVIVS